VTGSDPRATYEGRLTHWSREIARGDRRHLLVSNLRLIAVALAVGAAWLALGPSLLSPFWVLLPSLSFFALLVVHARILNTQDRAMRARRYFERGVSRLDGSWMGAGADGTRFLEGHLYARDLDLFGSGSLFQLLNTARTEAGEATLADWLRAPADRPEIESRQAAVAELRGRLDFRESLAILAAEAKVARDGTLATWAAAPPVGLGAMHARVLAACAVTTIAVVGLLIADLVPAGLAIGWVAGQAGIAFLWRRPVRLVVRGVDAAAYDLSLLAGLLGRLERDIFTSPRLRGLHEKLVVGDVPPSRRIARLQAFLAAQDWLRNELVRPFALLLLVRSQSAVAIDRWHAAHRAQLAEWLVAVGEFEALASLATYAFERPADPFPELRSGMPLFKAVALAHPLIPPAVAVPNDVQLGGPSPHALIVSGSNMSGKSTLLRAVGINAVLALAGAPVRAQSLVLSPMTIGATIRVEDSLQQGQSRFYAEILRIREIVASTERAPVLFLLDEILHGTNSHDRRIGAEAIVRALVDAGAIGLVTTHDLALTALTDTLGQHARNVHFQDRIERGTMVFDYRMREGVVEHSNALELMRAVGLKV
jgi:hypothetical protein